MNIANEFKNRRLKKKKTIRQVAAESGHSATTIHMYEKGEVSLDSISLGMAISIFDAIDTNVEDFFEDYFDIYSSVDKIISQIYESTPREYIYSKLKRRTMMRISRIKSSNRVSDDTYHMLELKYEDAFDTLKYKTATTNGVIQAIDYENEYLPLLYSLRRLEEEIDLYTTRGKILDALYRTDFLKSDLARIADISKIRMSGYLSGKNDFKSISVLSAIRISYALGFRLEDLFYNEYMYVLRDKRKK